MYQNAPRPQGNFFAMEPINAKNVLTVAGFPTNSSKPEGRVLIMGFGFPFTDNTSQNARMLTNAGFTHLERDIIVNRLQLPVSQRYRMLHDGEAKEAALAWAATMDNADAKKVHVQNYGNTRLVSSDDTTIYFEIGRRTYLANRGTGLGMVGFDIEVFDDATTGPRRQMFNRQALLGMVQGITESGDGAKIFQYGGSLADVVSYIKNKQDGDKYFRHPTDDWGGPNGFVVNENVLVNYFRANGSFVGRDQYARRTFDDRSLWQKNSNGTIKVDQFGNPKLVVMNYPTARVTNFGVDNIVYSYEPLYWLQMWYEEAEKILTDWRWLCNTPANSYDGSQTVGSIPYPKGSVDIRPGLENLRLCGWYRDETESESMGNPDNGGAGEYDEATGNHRKLNPRAIRFQLFMRSLLYHGNILWSDKAYYNFVQGAAYSQIEGGQTVAKPGLSMDQYRMMLAGNFQAKNFPEFFSLMDQHKLEFIIPKKFIYKGNVAVGEREIDKPIVWLFKEKDGLTVFGMWVYPCQDVNNQAHVVDIRCWIVLDSGATSGSYLLRCANRDTAYDGWNLPAGFATAKPENFRFQFTTILGQTFTWTGSYNVPFTGPNPTPPALITRVVTTTTS
ncbi:MAG: hypothetical protein EOO39_02660 [Cytophagaceae bacterium]|nr:MAG: hypothetical protein EOO39_02660 [Cytophagaceae bacterium]